MSGSAEQTLQILDDYAPVITAFVSPNTARSTNHFVSQSWELWHQIHSYTNLKDLQVKNQQTGRTEEKASC